MDVCVCASVHVVSTALSQHAPKRDTDSVERPYACSHVEHSTNSPRVSRVPAVVPTGYPVGSSGTRSLLPSPRPSRFYSPTEYPEIPGKSPSPSRREFAATRRLS